MFVLDIAVYLRRKGLSLASLMEKVGYDAERIIPYQHTRWINLVTIILLLPQEEREFQTRWAPRSERKLFFRPEQKTVR